MITLEIRDKHELHALLKTLMEVRFHPESMVLPVITRQLGEIDKIGKNDEAKLISFMEVLLAPYNPCPGCIPELLQAARHAQKDAAQEGDSKQ